MKPIQETDFAFTVTSSDVASGLVYQYIISSTQFHVRLPQFRHSLGLLMPISLLTTMCLHSLINGCSTEKNSPYIDKIQCSIWTSPKNREGQDTMTVNIFSPRASDWLCTSQKVHLYEVWQCLLCQFVCGRLESILVSTCIAWIHMHEYSSLCKQQNRSMVPGFFPPHTEDKTDFDSRLPEKESQKKEGKFTKQQLTGLSETNRTQTSDTPEH